MTQNLLATDEDLGKIDDSKNYLDELVGENKKFKSNEELAKGKAISDNYIKLLEKRLDESQENIRKYRDENIAGPKLQDLVDKLENLQKQLTSRDTTTHSNEDIQAVYDPKQVESLVSSKLVEHEQTKKEQDNYNLVSNKLKERLGSNYKDVLKEQAESLGLTDDDVNSMARKNPNLFIKTFDLDTARKETFQSPPRSGIRNDNFSPRAPEKRTWSYYMDMKKKDPRAWDNPQIRIQMDKDSQALGKDFFDA